LEIAGWRQFDAINITLHARLTILTGANGCGKTTLLNLFSRHFGFNQQLLATPKLDSSGAITFAKDLFRSVRRLFSSPNQHPPSSSNEIGTLVYSSGERTAILVPEGNSVQFQLTLQNQQAVAGVNIASRRPVSNYQPVANIPVNAMLPNTAYSSYFSETLNRVQGGHTGFSPIYRMKEALISMATFGPGNIRIQRNAQADDALAGFETVLRKVLPKSLGFQNFVIRQSDVVLATESGEFLLDAASGGVISLIDVCWQIFLFSLNNPVFAVTIDEPENHLHPSMQRSLMNDLLQAFPQAQFIVATHSPFIVSAAKDSTVYALRYFIDEKRPLIERRRIFSEQLHLVEKAGTAGEVLREVLGVPVTAPEWVETALNEIVRRYSEGPMDREKLASLKLELKDNGLVDYFPDALGPVLN
jgi:hypothetical protein